MVQKLPQSSGNTIGFKLSGQIHHTDYQEMTPQFDALVKEHGSINSLIELEKLEGIDVRAVWDDFTLGMKHYSHFNRIALVGDEDWEKWAVKLAKPFTKAEMKFFPASDRDKAWTWVKTGKA